MPDQIVYKPRGERSMSDAFIPLGAEAFAMILAILALIFMFWVGVGLVGGANDALEQRFARAGQVQGVAAAVGRCGPALHVAAGDEVLDGFPEARALHAEGLGERRLADPGIGRDQHQQTDLARGDAEPGEVRREMLEDQLLGPSELVAEQRWQDSLVHEVSFVPRRRGA